MLPLLFPHNRSDPTQTEGRFIALFGIDGHDSLGIRLLPEG